MESDMRRTGIDVIGEVPWGTHFCQFYEASQDLIEILVPYFKEGLTSNEFCMWVTSEPLKVDQATTALRVAVPDLDKYIDSGQIEILDYSQWYTRSGQFSADEVLRGWVDKLNAAQKRGYEGLRLTGNTFWLEKADWDDFTRYEETVNNVIGQYPMLAICTYSLQKCNAAELLDVIANHQFALIKRSGQWEIIESTQHKKIEQALQESEERYSTTLASIGDAVIATDFEGRITFMNAVAEELTGWHLHEAIMKPAKEVFIIINEHTRQKVENPVAKVLENGAIVGLANHTVLVRRDGTEVAIDDSGAPIKDRNGNITGVVLVFRDITDRKRMEDSLRESEERFRLLVDGIKDYAIFMLDPEGLVITWNEGAERLKGYKSEEIIGQDFSIFYTPEDVTQNKPHKLLDAAISREHVEEEGWRVRKDGSRFWASVVLTALHDELGNLRGFAKVTRDITEREKAMKEIENLAKFPEENPNPIMRIAANGAIIYANSSSAPLLELWGCQVGQRLPEECRDLILDVFRSRNSREIEILLHCATYSLVLAPITEMGYVNIYGRDITKRKQTEIALQESEQRYATTLASIGDAVIATDIEGRITFMNAVAEELTGWTFQEALQKPAKAVFNIINGDTRQKVVDPITKVLENGAIVGLANHTVLVRRDESEVAIDDSGAPIKDHNGNISGVVLVFRDITERKQAEEALRETKDYLENLIDYANAPIIVWDTSLNITRFNRAFERLTGLEAQDVLGRSLEVLFPERTREASLAYIRRTQSGERWDAVEIPILRTDGSVRTVLWNSANINDKEGTAIVATIAQGQDITDRKQMEMELLKARDDLELKVQERTAELQEALEAAEESVKAKAAFLANMSHELRTPMNAVIGFSSLLLDDNLTRDQREYIEGIRKGGEALLAIINDILDFSRAENDKLELEHQPFSLKHLIDESLDMVANQASKKGLNLSETINYGTPDTIIGDHGRLRQILVNLLTNAVKFTDNGNVSVSVSSKAAEGDRHQILFKVKDTGIGIPQDKMNEIFEPFVQVERTLSRKRDGVGLGLAITKNLVELMGGRIWVESIPGQGATFHFTIQAEIIPGKQLDFGRMDSGIASESLSGLKPMRILVAEDNPSNQRVLVEMLKRLGYRADAVADGREVIQALERQDYDLVLMDIKMPEMDGITATQVIRKLRPENGPKIIAITAFALEGDREKCLEAGMDDYIAKPVQMRDLAEVLKKNQPSSVGS